MKRLTIRSILVILTILTGLIMAPLLTIPGLASESDTDADAAGAAENDSPTAIQKEDAASANEDDVKPEPRNLREAVTRSLQTFVPSEAIDVDKPVDFPTNI